MQCRKNEQLSPLSGPLWRLAIQTKALSKSILIRKVRYKELLYRVCSAVQVRFEFTSPYSNKQALILVFIDIQRLSCISLNTISSYFANLLAKNNLIIFGSFQDASSTEQTENYFSSLYLDILLKNIQALQANSGIAMLPPKPKKNDV